MTTPEANTPSHGHTAALQTLFPGGVAALDAQHARGLLDQYMIGRLGDGGPSSTPAASAMFGAAAGHQGQGYELRPGGVARIAWEGPMGQRPHPLLRTYLGYVDTSELAQAVQAATHDPQARSIMLVVNSPGGAIPGVAELSAIVAEAARSKPVVAVTESEVCSAAYWAVSGCSNIYGTGPVVSAGSIGVVMVHVYSPRTDGAVVTEITAGKYKRVISSHKPLSSEGAADLQEKVDYLTQQFVNGVATNRKLSAAAVAAQDGRTYIGQQAVEAGLLDGFMTVSELERQLAAEPSRFMRRRAGAAANTPTPIKTTSASSATTWPPKLQPVVSAPVTPESMLEITGRAEEDLRAEAAELVRMHKLTTGRWPKVMKSWKDWEHAGALRARQDGCTHVLGIKREGYLHPYVSTLDSPKRGTPGVKPTIELTKKQLAERGAAWSAFRNVSVLEAFKYLGFKG